jgi:hypothetical protein
VSLRAHPGSQAQKPRWQWPRPEHWFMQVCRLVTLQYSPCSPSRRQGHLRGGRGGGGRGSGRGVRLCVWERGWRARR